MEKIACIILAAGLGKRMGGELPKVLTKTDEMTLLEHVLAATSSLSLEKTVIVTGYKRELVQKLLADSSLTKNQPITCAFQPEQLGTGDAVKSALPELKDFSGMILILPGDAPLITGKTLQSLITFHSAQKSTISLLSFKCTATNNPYGRIIRTPDCQYVNKIVEVKDCCPGELQGSEVNAGMYVVDSAFLAPALKELSNDNAQKEYYLTDIVAKAFQEGQRISAFTVQDESEALGVNTRGELGAVNRILNSRRLTRLEETGVQFLNPESVLIGPEVQVEPGAIIGPSVQLSGKTSIASGVKIEGTAVIIDSILGPNSLVKLGSRIEGAEIGEDCSVGPFANIRAGTKLGAKARIGNFVEAKNAELAPGVKAGHLSYLGDCVIGEDTNIGAGTITCNYDGHKKHKTEIGKGVFVGSNSTLVAPLKIDDGAFLAAGSTITKNVSKDSLAFGRAQQVEKKDWGKVWREKNK